jgi:hypothetical protein
LGGFNGNKTMNEEEQHILQKELAQFLITKVFNCPTSDDLIQMKPAQMLPIPKKATWIYKRKQISEGDIQTLKAQANTFLNSKLWEVLKGSLQYQSYNRGFIKSQTESDQIAGKLIGFIVNEIEGTLNKIIEN